MFVVFEVQYFGVRSKTKLNSLTENNSISSFILCSNSVMAFIVDVMEKNYTSGVNLLDK